MVQDEVRLTFGQCRARAARLAHHLSNERGMKPGDRIGLALPNSPEWMVAFIAVSAIGAVPALINARAGKAEFDHCLASTGCRLCLGEGQNPEAAIDVISMNQVRRLSSGDTDHPLPDTPRKPEDEALLMFTSGTTGLPKGASMTHEAVLTALKTIQYSGVLIAEGIAKAAGIDPAMLMRMRPPPVNLLVFPLFHVSGCHAVFSHQPRAGRQDRAHDALGCRAGTGTHRTGTHHRLSGGAHHVSGPAAPGNAQRPRPLQPHQPVPSVARPRRPPFWPTSMLPFRRQ